MAIFPKDAVLHKGDRPAGDPDPEYVLTVQGVPGAEPLVVTGGAAVQPTEDAADGTIGLPFGDIILAVGGKDTATGTYTPLTLTNGALNINATFSGTVSHNLTEWANTVLAAPTAYGTPPSGNVIGVNAYVSNAPSVDPNNQLETSSIGLTLNETGQALVGPEPTLITPANADQAGVLITNSSPVIVYVGTSEVSTTTGLILMPGQFTTIPTVSAVYGIVEVASPPNQALVSFMSLTE
jgi:hypothetical protein